MYFLYSVLLALAMLVTLPYWVFQMLRHGKYRAGLWERLGRVPVRLRTASMETASAQRVSPNPASQFSPVIWVHAVSVGEVMAIRGLVEDIRRRFAQSRVVVTTTTDTGQALARKTFGEDNAFYFPMDFGFAIRPYLQTLRPKLIIIAETEFWPNFLRLAHARGSSIAVVNARISDRSWPNYNRFSWLLKKVLPNIDLFLAQTEADRKRLTAMGAPAKRVSVTGNLKFDLTLPAPPPIVDSVRQSLQQANAGPVLVCGSTVEGEEPLLLKAFENILVRHPRAVMILAPRHPERFNNVAALMAQMNIHFWRRSRWKDEPLLSAEVLSRAVDTILLSRRSMASPSWWGTTPKISATSSACFRAAMRYGLWAPRNCRLYSWNCWKMMSTAQPWEGMPSKPSARRPARQLGRRRHWRCCSRKTAHIPALQPQSRKREPAGKNEPPVGHLRRGSGHAKCAP